MSKLFILVLSLSLGISQLTAACAPVATEDSRVTTETVATEDTHVTTETATIEENLTVEESSTIIEDTSMVSDSSEITIIPNVPPTIVSVSNVHVETTRCTCPLLPDVVDVYYDNGTCTKLPVAWETFDVYSYQVPGTFNVKGTVEDGFSVNCAISVYPTRDDSFSIIRDDTYVRDTITVNNNANYTVPTQLSKSIYNTINYYNDIYGIKTAFTVISLKDYTTISYNADDTFAPASVLKAPYALYIYKEIAKGNLSLDDYVRYQSYFWERGCGIIKESAPGTPWSLKDILFHTINISDNSGYYMLRAKGGVEGYGEMLKDLGCTTIDPARPWSKVSPHDLAILWNEIYNFSFTCPEGELFFNTLVDAEYNFIKNALNSYQKVAHKSGNNDKGYNDCAVVFGDSDPNAEFVTNDYIVVIMTKTYDDQQANKVLLSDLAKDIDLVMKDLTLSQNS